jgi:hypothetical protein
MESVYAVFEYLNESSWIDFLQDDYGFPQYNRKSPRSDPDTLHTILTELHGSSWADSLEDYRRDIEEDLGIKFMSVKEMRNVYLRNELLKIDGVGYDIAERIADMV